jgi:hypothetical protein
LEAARWRSGLLINGGADVGIEQSQGGSGRIEMCEGMGLGLGTEPETRREDLTEGTKKLLTSFSPKLLIRLTVCPVLILLDRTDLVLSAKSRLRKLLISFSLGTVGGGTVLLAALP